MMRQFLRLCFLVVTAAASLPAQQQQQQPTVSSIISRARASIAPELKLQDLVTLQMVGALVHDTRRVPPAKIVIIASKPTSQRMEVRIEDLVETTFFNAGEGCLVRSTAAKEKSQMRWLSVPELERVGYNTRQLFSYYRPDVKNGEHISYQGVESRHGVNCHKLHYAYPDGLTTIRYFSTQTAALVSTIIDSGIESVTVESSRVQGILFPRRIDYYDAGKKTHSITFSKIIVNNSLPEGIFDFPIIKKNDGS